MVDVDRNLTLAELEPAEWPLVRWGQAEYGDPLVERCYAASKIPLKDLENGAIRLLIGQQCGLPYLIPLALERLKVDPLLEGTHYPGDLFSFVWRLNPEFWATYPKLWEEARAISDQFWPEAALRREEVDEDDENGFRKKYEAFLANRPGGSA